MCGCQYCQGNAPEPTQGCCPNCDAAIARRRLSDDIDARFTFHPVQPGQAERYAAMRSMGRDLAHAIVDATPPSREQSTALTKLQEVIMWANAAIAIHEDES